MRNRRAEVAFNETLPVFGTLLVDDLGYLWAKNFKLPGDSTNSWAVFDSTGIWLGTVRTPDRVVVWQIGPDFVVGTLWDESDVAYVGVWELERGGSRR